MKVPAAWPRSTKNPKVRSEGGRGGLCLKLKDTLDSIPVRRILEHEEGRAEPGGVGCTLFTIRAPGDPDPPPGRRAQSLVRSVPWSRKLCLAVHWTLDTLRHTQGGTLRDGPQAGRGHCSTLAAWATRCPPGPGGLAPVLGTCRVTAHPVRPRGGLGPLGRWGGWSGPHSRDGAQARIAVASPTSQDGKAGAQTQTPREQRRHLGVVSFPSLFPARWWLPSHPRRTNDPRKRSLSLAGWTFVAGARRAGREGRLSNLEPICSWGS